MDPAYCVSRYGSCLPAMQQAWTLLRQSAYASHTWMTNQAFQTEPSTHPVSAQIDSGPTFQKAVALFLSCSGQLSANGLYRNDLIELVAQAVGGHIDQQLALAAQAIDARQSEAAADAAARALDWMHRIDGLMNLRPRPASGDLDHRCPLLGKVPRRGGLLRRECPPPYHHLGMA